MGKWIHRLSYIDLDNMTAMCSNCGLVSIKLKGQRLPRCVNSWGSLKNSKYRKNKPLSKCNRCGFNAVDKCQIDMHHIDGDHENNNDDNLEPVCANCHRLISKFQAKEKFKKIDTVLVNKYL